MNGTATAAADDLWLELPPMAPGAPARLLVFLHGAGSSPEVIAPVALAWQLKFPGATAAILRGLRSAAPRPGHDWFAAGAAGPGRDARIAEAVRETARRVRAVQAATGLPPERTALVGFSQGATIALELVRHDPALAAIVVSYAGRLARPIRRDETLFPTIHLLHGALDSQVPALHSRRAFAGLRAVGADVTLDVAADDAHSIGQTLVNRGTARVMQTVFRGRRPQVPGPRPAGRTLH